MVFQKEGDIMHKYMRTIGFSQYTSRQDLDKLLKKLVKDASKSDILKESDGEMFCELRAQTAPGMGVAIAGRLSQRGIFKQEYYFPYVESSQVTSTADCSIQRHTERETFAGLLDEYRVGISLIFYMENSMEYRLRLKNSQPVLPKSASLSALSIHGKILLPVQKTPQQTEDRKKAASKRSRLIEAAKRGDEEAIETLTPALCPPALSVTSILSLEIFYLWTAGSTALPEKKSFFWAWNATTCSLQLQSTLPIS